MTTKHLTGLKIVLTGDFDAYERDAAIQLLEDLGADVTSSVSGKTQCVVAGKNPGATKLGAAEKRGLPLLNEPQLLALIAGATLEQVLAGTAAPTAAKAEPPAPPKVPFPFKEAAPRTGPYVEKWPSGGVKLAGPYVDGLRHGSWKRYFESGKLQQDYTWAKGFLDGPELDWREDGTKICDGRNVRGKRIGTWTWWHDNGAYNLAEHHDANSLKQGELVWDLPDKSPRGRGQYLDDKLHGLWTWWQEKDYEKVERGYRHGTQHGPEKAWYYGGKLALERTWHLGRKHGVERTYDSDGKLTYQGQWHCGYAIGEHMSNGERTTYVDGLPAALVADTKLRDKVLKKLKKAKDRYAKADAIGDQIEYTQRAPYLVALWKGGEVDVGADRELWVLFSEAHALLSGDDVVKFLTTAKPGDDYGEVLPYWPAPVDCIVMHVYARDPAPIDAARASLPTQMKHGVDFVRARFGHDVGDALHGELGQLVKKFVEQYGCSEVLWPDADGLVVQQKLFTDFRGTHTPLFETMIGFFGGFEKWAAALKPLAFKEAAESVARVAFRTFRPVIERATPAEMAVLIDGVSLGNDTQDELHEALTRWRKDDAATTAEIVLAMKEGGLRRWPAVATAILALAAEGKEVPQALVDALALATESPNYTSSWYTDPLREVSELQRNDPAYRTALIDASVMGAVPRTALLRRALKALTAGQVRSVIERHLAGEYGKTVVAQFLYLVEDDALLERFLDVAEADSYGHHDTTMYGVGEVGLRIVPLLERRLAKATKADRRIGWKKALVVALARGLVDHGDIPPALDQHVTFDLGDDYDYRWLAPFLERILFKLPMVRAEAILVRELKTARFSRAFRHIACAPTGAVLELAFTELLAREAKFKHEQQQDVSAGISALHNAVDWVRWVRQSGGGGGLGDALKTAIGWQAFEALDKELAAAGTQAAKQLDHVDKVVLRAKDSGGGKERIYLLRKLAQGVQRDDFNIVGGKPPGIDAARWPTYDDEPMDHLFTLDLKMMPELRARLGTDAANVRTVSVFCWHPDMNEAYEAETEQTAVVMSTQAQIDAGGGPPEEVALMTETRFEAVAVDVGPSAWAEGELREELYRCHARVLGEPLWLQSEEDGCGEYLMQCDEGFVPMNLGDCGILYLFSADAFWQCH